MKIKLNGIEFEVVPVTGAERAVLLADPVMAPGLRRDVYRWDHATQAGEVLASRTPTGGVVLPNGLTFHVGRTTEAGTVVKNEAATQKMAERFLKAVKARSSMDVLKSLNSIVNLPQKTLPFKEFAGLNASASYAMRMYVDFSVVTLRAPSRNLAAHLFVPGQVAFLAHVSAMAEGVTADSLTPPQAAFIVPARTDANRAIRRIATARRLEELQAAITAAGGAEAAPPELRLGLVRAATEWRMLSQPSQGKALPAVAANRTAAPATGGNG